MSSLSSREEFLIAMYNQLMNDINRHIIVVWQSIAVLGATVAAFGFVEKGIISIDIASTLVLVTSIWLLGHVYDASYWYNRNLVIIANIERQFLNKEDLRNIHYYFGAHRPTQSMISHLRMQKWLAVTISALVLLANIFERLLPLYHRALDFEFQMLAPWAVALIGLSIWRDLSKSTANKYDEFLSNSPGISVDTSDISYGIGHGFDQTKAD